MKKREKLISKYGRVYRSYNSFISDNYCYKCGEQTHLEKDCPRHGRLSNKLHPLKCKICNSIEHNTNACKMTKDVAPLQITVMREEHKHLGLSVFQGRSVTVIDPISIKIDENGKRTEVRDENKAARIENWLNSVPTDEELDDLEWGTQWEKKWVPKGFGVVYLLKDKETGKTRILSRVGTGKLTLNYNPLKGSKYAIHPKKDTMVTAAFWDHLHTTEPALGQFIMTTSKADDASELARILTEGTPQ